MVVAVWGTNFVIMHEGLAHFPSLTFATLRFFFAAFPLVFLVPRPKTGMLRIAAYGVLIGVGQFGLLLYALNGHIAPGLASLLIQTQVFFTVALAVLINGERVGSRNLFALALSAAGVGSIALHTGGGNDLLGICLVLGAALGWAGGNIVAKHAGAIDMFGLVIWSSLFAVPPLLAGALILEGLPAMTSAVTAATPTAWATVLWQSLGNSVFGYGVWNWLLSRHTAARIAPLSLMVPVFGMSAASLFLGEAMPLWKLGAAMLIIAGLVINLRAPPVAQAAA